MLKRPFLRCNASRSSRGVWVLAGSLALLSFTGLSCRHGDVLKELPKELADVLPLGEKRPLEVVLASPQGIVSQSEPIKTVSVAFNQPMVPLQPVPVDETAAPMTIEPSVPGRFRWKGTATLTFEAKDPLPFGTHYKVRLPKGTKSWSGQQLAADYEFEFTTPVAGLLGSLPVASNDKAGLNGPIFLHFNQPMDAAGAAAFIDLQVNGKAVAFDVRPYASGDGESENKRVEQEGYAQSGDEAGHRFNVDWIPAKDAPSDSVLVVIPKEPLALSSTVSVTLKPGLHGRQGQVGLQEARTLEFTTYGPLTYKGESRFAGSPEDGIKLSFSNGVSPAELSKHVTIEPKVAIPDSASVDTYTSETPVLYLNLAPRTHYKVVIDADLKDSFGQRLGKQIQLDFSAGDYHPSLNMAEGLGLLESKGPLRIPLGIRNVDHLEIQLAKLNRQQAISVLENSESLNGEKPYTPPGGFTRKVAISPSSTPNKIEERTLNFTPADGPFVYCQAHSNVDKERRSSFVLISNIGVTCKSSAENCVIWATSLKDAQPLAGADIEILDSSGTSLWTGKTDSSGVVQSPGWAALGLKKKNEYDSAPGMYVFAKHGGEETFIRTEHAISPGDLVSYDYQQSARRFSGYAFSERGLYKPGEKIELKGTLRELKSSQWGISDLTLLPYTVQDSRGNTVTSGNLTLNEFGSFTHEVALTAQAPTGHYSVSYMTPPDLVKSLKLPSEIMAAGFEVEEFRPAQFEVTVKPENLKPDNPYYIMGGDKARATIKGYYLFGAPMNESVVKWSARIEPASLRPQGDAFEGYSFESYGGEEEQSRDVAKILTEKSGVLDAQGLQSVEASLDNIDYKGSGNLVIEGSVRSASRQELSGRAVVPLYRGEFQIGLRGSSAVATAGQKFKLETVAVTPEGKLLEGQKISLQLVRREWKSVRKAGVDGTYQWASEAQDEIVSTQEVTSGTAAVSQEMTAPKAGYYVVHASAVDSRKNKISSECSFYVSGSDYVGWERVEGDGIKLVPDKKSYKPGDTAKILVQNPYEGKTRALVTLEREHILEQYVQEVTGSTPVIEIPLRSQHLPNVYVSVVLLKGRLADKGFGPDGDDLGKPSFRIGCINLPVESGEKKLTVTLKTDKASYLPGDEVTVSADVKDSKGQGVAAEFSLAAADVGVLNLINFKTPDYFDTFYGSRSLGVSTSESRQDVIGQRAYGSKGANQGGGGGLNESSLRADFKYTAYWDPSVRTDGQGHATAKFKLPDNLTSFRLMAVAQTKGSDFGSGETKFTVKKMLQLQPTVPSFARVGDDFQAGVAVHNNSDAAITAEVDLKATNLPVVGETHQTVSVAAGKDKEVLFHFKPDKTDTAQLTFSAKAGDLQDSVQVNLPVQLASVTETVSTSGSTTDPSTVELAAPSQIVPGTGFLQINLSSSALVGLQAAASYNLNYGFLCLEQRMSKVMPILASLKLIKGMQLKDDSEAALKAKVEEQIGALPGFQCESGGFRLWPDGRDEDVNDFVTAYVLEVLKAAQAQGYSVDSKLLERTVVYLKTVLNNASICKLPYSLDERWVNRTYTLYVLALWKHGDAAELHNQFSERAQMSLTAKSYLLQAAYLIEGSESMIATLRQELQNSIHLEAATAHFTEAKELSMPWIYSSNRETTAVVLKALLDGKKSFEPAPKVVAWLMESRDKDGTFGSTYCNTRVLQAFGSYLDKFEKADPNFTAQVKMGSEVLLSQTFKGRSTPVAHKVVALKPTDSKLPLSFEKQGSGRLYYDLSMTYANAQPQPARDEGMAIFKSISDVKTGKKLAEFTAGDTYMVTLSLVTPAERHFVVLSDPIPAGFEVVQTDFATESQDMKEILDRANQKTPGYTFSHFEKYQDRVLLFAEGLQAGEHTFRYLVRANQPGLFLMPSSKSEEMYHPEVFGITAPTNITIK